MKEYINQNKDYLLKIKNTKVDYESKKNTLKD